MFNNIGLASPVAQQFDGSQAPALFSFLGEVTSLTSFELLHDGQNSVLQDFSDFVILQLPKVMHKLYAPPPND
jgi:hypothetical protein